MVMQGEWNTESDCLLSYKESGVHTFIASLMRSL